MLTHHGTYDTSGNFGVDVAISSREIHIKHQVCLIPDGLSQHELDSFAKKLRTAAMDFSNNFELVDRISGRRLNIIVSLDVLANNRPLGIADNYEITVHKPIQIDPIDWRVPRADTANLTTWFPNSWRHELAHRMLGTLDEYWQPSGNRPSLLVHERHWPKGIQPKKTLMQVDNNTPTGEYFLLPAHLRMVAQLAGAIMGRKFAVVVRRDSKWKVVPSLTTAKPETSRPDTVQDAAPQAASAPLAQQVAPPQAPNRVHPLRKFLSSLGGRLGR